jgi:hypothetical protein
MGGGIPPIFLMSITMIDRELITDSTARVALTHRLFGLHFPIKLEGVVYGFARALCKEYKGGFWRFYALSNGGFLMAPDSADRFAVASMNGYCCKLSADAFGITVCLFAFSQLSFDADPFAATSARHFHLLRDMALDHAEAPAIFAAID